MRTSGSMEQTTSDPNEDPGVVMMLAYQAGDEAAFERLVERYSPMVYALLYRFLGTRPGREDLVQEVFLRVVKARERYQPTARLSTWLYRIIFNLAVNETQRVDRTTASLDKPLGSGDDGEFTLGHLAESSVEAPSAALERDDIVQAVRAAIAALPDNQRMALVLAKYHDQPYSEIAKVLGSSEKAIKSLVHRAREALRERLAPLLAQGDVA